MHQIVAKSGSSAPACSAMMAESSRGPALRTAAAFCAMTELQTSATIVTATSCMKGATRATTRGAFWFSAAPSSTGASTTCQHHQAVCIIQSLFRSVLRPAADTIR